MRAILATWGTTYDVPGWNPCAQKLRCYLSYPEDKKSEPSRAPLLTLQGATEIRSEKPMASKPHSTLPWRTQEPRCRGCGQGRPPKEVGAQQ